MTSTKWTAELIPEMLSRQMMIGRKKNFAIDASMKPLKRSRVIDRLTNVSTLEYEVSSRIIVKNDRLARI